MENELAEIISVLGGIKGYNASYVVTHAKMIIKHRWELYIKLDKDSVDKNSVYSLVPIIDVAQRFSSTLKTDVAKGKDYRIISWLDSGDFYAMEIERIMPKEKKDV